MRDRSLVLFNTTNGMVPVPRPCSTSTAWRTSGQPAPNGLSMRRMGNKNNGGTPRFEVLGGTVTATNDNYVGVSDNAELVVNGGTFRALRYFNVGQYGGTAGIARLLPLECSITAISTETPTGISTVLYLGKSARRTPTAFSM